MCDVCFASKKSSEREFLVPARTNLDLGVKLYILYITSITPKTMVLCCPQACLRSCNLFPPLPFAMSAGLWLVVVLDWVNDP